jgi:hypothetical protein
MASGGARAGAGRPKGAATRKTREIADKAASEGLMPLEFMLQVMRNPNADMPQRLDMAKSAAPYLHPRLANIDVGNKDDKPFEQVIRWALTDSEATPDPSKK